MNRIALALASLVPSLAAANGPMAFHSDGTSWHPAFQICDMKDHAAVTYYTNGSIAEYLNGNNENWGLTYRSFEKARPQVNLTLTNSEGEDCGMGHCWTRFRNGEFTYNVNITSYGVFEGNDDAPGVNMGRIDVRKGEESIFSETCRTLPRTRIACLTGKRSIHISEDASGGLEYRAFSFADHSDTPSLFLRNGSEDHAMGGKVAYRFANGDYKYTVYTSQTVWSGMTPSARVEVSKNGRLLSTEECSSYQISHANLMDE